MMGREEYEKAKDLKHSTSSYGSLTRTRPSVAAGFHSIQTAGHLVVIGALDDLFKQVETGGTPAWLE